MFLKQTTKIKILAENEASNTSKPTSQSNTNQFRLVKRKTNPKSYKVKNQRKLETKYPNQYETLYITDSEEENNNSQHQHQHQSTTSEFSSGN